MIGRGKKRPDGDVMSGIFYKKLSGGKFRTICCRKLVIKYIFERFRTLITDRVCNQSIEKLIKFQTNIRNGFLEKNRETVWVVKREANE